MTSESYYSPAERFFYSGDDPSVHSQHHDDDDENDDDDKSVEQSNVVTVDLHALPALIDTAAVRRKWRPYAGAQGDGGTASRLIGVSGCIHDTYYIQSVKFEQKGESREREAVDNIISCSRLALVLLLE